MSGWGQSWGDLVQSIGLADSSLPCIVIWIANDRAQRRTCSSPHCQDDALLIRSSRPDTRGWCVDHLPSWAAKDEMIADALWARGIGFVDRVPARVTEHADGGFTITPVRPVKLSEMAK